MTESSKIISGGFYVALIVIVSVLLFCNLTTIQWNFTIYCAVFIFSAVIIHSVRNAVLDTEVLDMKYAELLSVIILWIMCGVILVISLIFIKAEIWLILTGIAILIITASILVVHSLSNISRYIIDKSINYRTEFNK